MVALEGGLVQIQVVGSRNSFDVVIIISGIFRKHHVAARAGRELSHG